MSEQFRATPKIACRRAALWLGAGLVAAAAMALPSAADARGFVSFGVGVPLGPPAYYPPPVYYAPPPVYYAPPPAYYYPPPVAYAAPPAPPLAPSVAPEAGQTCREYQSTTTIEGRPQQTYGTACLQPDGTWKIVR